MVKLSENEYLCTARIKITVCYSDIKNIFLDNKEVFLNFLKENDNDYDTYNDEQINKLMKIAITSDKYQNYIQELIYNNYQNYIKNKKLKVMNMKDIIPGNHPKCKEIDPKNIGKNFIWNHWQSYQRPYKDEPIFYSIEDVKCFKYIKNNDGKYSLTYLKSNINILGSDIRIACIKGEDKPILYSSDLINLYLINYLSVC